MTVTWKQSAIDDRAGFLDDALKRAIAAPDPLIYDAATDQDERIEREGNGLDGDATYAEGPIPGTRIYTCKGGKYMLIYTRDASNVDILWVAPARSNWKPTL
jgi:hypothetical protein